MHRLSSVSVLHPSVSVLNPSASFVHPSASVLHPQPNRAFRIFLFEMAGVGTPIFTVSKVEDVAKYITMSSSSRRFEVSLSHGCKVDFKALCGSSDAVEELSLQFVHGDRHKQDSYDFEDSFIDDTELPVEDAHSESHLENEAEVNDDKVSGIEMKTCPSKKRKEMDRGKEEGKTWAVNSNIEWAIRQLKKESEECKNIT